jgi:drug/metabolite transporter (DMT)-like permease
MTATPSTGVPPSRAVQVGSLLALGVMWGGSFMVLKIAVGTVPAASTAAARLVIAAVILVAAAYLAGHRMPKSLHAWRLYFLMGGLGAALPFTLIGWGEESVDSGLAAILMAVSPLTTAILAHLFTAGETMTLRRLAGVLLGLAGVVVLIGPAALKGLGDEAAAQLAVVMGAVCYASANIVARHLPKEPDMVNSAGMMAAAAAMWVPVALFADRPWELSPTMASMAAIVALGLLPTALATLIYLRLVRTAGPTFVSFSNYLVPIFGVLSGVVVLGETLHPNAAFALALVLAGIALARRRRAATPSPSQGDNS